MLALSDLHSSQRSLTWPDAAFILQCTYLEKTFKVWQSELCHMGEAVLAVEGACSMRRAGPPLE